MPVTGVEPTVPRPLDFPPGSFLPASSGRFFLDLFATPGSSLVHAAQALRVDTIFLFDPVDTYLSLNILDDAHYEQMLRLVWGGWIAALWAAPHLGASDSHPAPSSLTTDMACRNRALLTAAHSRGAAVAWDASPEDLLDPQNADMLCSWNATCCNVAGCVWGVDMPTSWFFCTNVADMRSLASQCSCLHRHVPDAVLGGVSYPPKLALAIIQIFCKACSCDGQSMRLRDLPLTKSGAALKPVQTCDGAGVHSTADWTATDKPDLFLDLRDRLWHFAHEHRVDSIIVDHIQQQKDGEPLSLQQFAPFMQLTDNWFRERGFSPCWSVDPGQSFRLNLLQSLVAVTQDPDLTLIAALKQGVPTGVLQPLEPTGLWPRKTHAEQTAEPLLLHHTNWQGADEEPDVTQSLIDAEIANGWVQELHGGLEEAKRRWQHIAVGKLNVVKVPNKAPRLILDSSCCAVNQNCRLPESMILPSVDDARRASSSSHDIGEFSALVLDIHAAHKQICLHPKEQGLVLFQFNNRTYFYTVAHFGARFSAWWWQRLAALILRLLHQFLHSGHRGWIYVDDILLLFRRTSFTKQVTLAVLFLLLINTPISWRKAQLGDCVTWTGWDFNFRFDTVQLTASKVTKLLGLLQDVLAKKQAKAKALETTLGMLIWFTSVARFLRPQLADIYRCLHSPPAALYSVPAQFWAEFLSVLNDAAVVISASPSLALPLGGRVVEYSHFPIHSKNDLPRVPIKSHLQWLRVQDLGASSVTLTKEALSHLRWFYALVSRSHHIFSLHLPTPLVIKAAADAYAHDESLGIGGWIITPKHIVWFSEQFSMSQLKGFLPKLTKDAQKYICAFEILAQVALVMAACQQAALRHLAVTLPSASDNTAAEVGINKLLTTRWPASVFLQMLGSIAFQHQVHLSVSHIPGPRNDWADDLSRNRTQKWLHYPRFRVSLEDFFNIGRRIHLYPPKDWPAHLLTLQAER